MTRVVLINPSCTFFPGTNGRLPGPSYTLAAVAAWYRQEGYDVIVVDALASENRQKVGDEELAGFTPGIIGEYSRYLMPDLIGVTASWTVQFANVERILGALQGLPTIVGGHDATVRPEAYRQIGAGSVHIGEVETYSSLDDLPLPAWELLPMNYYKGANRDHHGSTLRGGVPVVTSRGCPHRCNFCTVHLSMGRRWRAHSPHYVIGMLEKLEALGFRSFHFEDDNLTCDRARWFQVMERMIGRSWSWDTPNGVRLDHLDVQFLSLAKRSGCVELRVAPESADETTVERIGKCLDPGRLESVAKMCLEAGIRLSAFWVVGIPGETLDGIRQTFAEAARMETEYAVVPRISIATPFPGTDLLCECEKKGWLDRPLTDRSLAAGTHLLGLIRTPDFTPQDIAGIYADWTASRN